MSPVRAWCALAACLALATPSLSCEGAGQRRKTILLSTEYADLDAGEDAAREIEAEMGIYDDPELTAYVEEVGRRLVVHAPLRPFQYRFKIVNQMAPNAFALPGGHIYVSRGLLALANSEAELAGVLGHEIIHSAERHASAQQELARRISPFLMPYFRFARLAGYSRDHERAADRGGQEIAAKAGYDPGALAEFLKRLGDTERLLIGYSRLPTYFDTHPGTTERVATTATHHLEWTPAPGVPTTREAYLRRLRGVVLDTDPREGIFHDTEFVHPDLDFRILFPRGWQLVNTHRAVGAISPSNDARIFITLEPPLRKPGSTKNDPDEKDRADQDNETAAGDRDAGAGELEPVRPTPEEEVARMPTAEQAADRFARDEGGEFEIKNIVRRGTVQIGEVEAVRVEFRGSMGGAGVAGQATFVPHDGFVLRVMAVALPGAWSDYVGRAHTTVRTFRRLTDEERSEVRVLHLRLVSAIEGEDISTLSRRTGNTWGPGRTAVLNGVFVNERLSEGDLLKISYAVPYEPEPPSLPEGVKPADDASETEAGEPEGPETATAD